MTSLADLHFELPAERIAQRPCRPREAARLLCMDRRGGGLSEAVFADLPDAVGPHDLFVVNDTRVVPARLRGHKVSGGRAEALLLERRPDATWTARVRCGGHLRPGLEFGFGPIRARIADLREDGTVRLAVETPDGRGVDDWLREIGEAPLPPYIRREQPVESDLADYQSVFADEPGAVAAPTASLHFSEALAARLRVARLTLHVGPGTFAPVRCERLEDHRIDAERFRVPESCAHAIADARAAGGRVIAVGTTVVRALETTGGAADEGRTDLMIAPGFEFRVVDALITNFHLPGSTLLALVMAFAGVEHTRTAYAYAIEKGYRFYSYGDAMWIR